MNIQTAIRRRLECRGTLQGVGFRPAVFRLATGLGLGGWVRNAPGAVTIEVEGRPEDVTRFIARLPGELPAGAKLLSLHVHPAEVAGARGFRVADSVVEGAARATLPPDSAPCAACRREMEERENRRYRYPFTTCSQCGPRFSIVERLPYDRERTSMRCFPLCRACAGEYDDPAERRFHAEPLSCPDCGPRLRFTAPARPGVHEVEAALAAARELLAAGGILAVKGLGGYQLACRADREDSVARLRERKRRPVKPLALMVRDRTVARRLVRLTDAEEAVLAAPEAPILLAPRHPQAPAGAPLLAPGVAPGSGDLGVMLATTPLHIELFRGARYDALVMTSGNASDEPIACGNREARGRLAVIADAFLDHDRDVLRRLDDSVLRTGDPEPFMVRRARGWVPRALPLPERAPLPLLALGGHLQTNACLALGADAIPSQHVGDLDNDQARSFLREAAEGLEQLFAARAAAFACDLHPDYASTWLAESWSRERGATLLQLPHHVAHAAAVLAEHGAFPQPGEAAAALVMDGSGWGPDATAWGGEWLLLDGELNWRRLAHLSSFPLVGGERAVTEPWRVAVALLAQAEFADQAAGLPLAAELPRDLVAAVRSQARQPGWPRATGAGRVFEAAGAVLGLAQTNTYEGEAAARLEALAAESPPVEPWPDVRLPSGDSTCALPVADLLAAAARRVADGVPGAQVAMGFHETFCELALSLTRRALPPSVRVVALAGGCFINRILRRTLAARLATNGYTVWLPVQTPPGDGGLSYGQAVMAALAMARARRPRQE